MSSDPSYGYENPYPETSQYYDAREWNYQDQFQRSPHQNFASAVNMAVASETSPGFSEHGSAVATTGQQYSHYHHHHHHHTSGELPSYSRQNAFPSTQSTSYSGYQTYSHSPPIPQTQEPMYVNGRTSLTIPEASYAQEPSPPPPPPTSSTPANRSSPKSCAHCHSTQTPMWRREPGTGIALCNACGLYIQQRRIRRPQELIDADSVHPGTPQPPLPPGSPECSHCHTRTTSVWRRNKGGKQVCNACGVYERLKGKERPLHLAQKRGERPPKPRLSKRDLKANLSQPRSSRHDGLPIREGSAFAPDDHTILLGTLRT